ncbi:MAG TPA: YitT family protein, partial [Anaerolineales bacterium]
MAAPNKSILQYLGNFSWQALRDYGLIGLGALLQALAIRLFLVPSNLVNGGVSGLAQIINHFTGFPLGLMILIGNVPLFVMGWRYLGGRRFAIRSVFAVVAVSLFTDLLITLLPSHGLTKDLVLNTLYGGIISGVGYGLVYMGQGTSGGTDILARILRHYRGVSLSASYMITDSAVMFIAGLAFSWENALYALVMLYVSGIAAEAVMGGSNVLRTAVIITESPDRVAGEILHTLERGVTKFPATGAYTGAERVVLYCVVTRSEVSQVKALVHAIDPLAFMVIGEV